MFARADMSSSIVLFVVVIILCNATLVCKGEEAPVTTISTLTAFQTGTQFPIPDQNATISFEQGGYYERSVLENDTWVFTNLQLNPPSGDLLADSPSVGNLNLSAHNSNVTVACFDRLISPYPNNYQRNASWSTQGWLNYTAIGIGTQSIKIQFGLVGSTPPSPNGAGIVDWPIIVSFYAGGNATETGFSGDDWPRPYGIGLVVVGAVSNVSVGYNWVPAPINPSQTTSMPVASSDRALEPAGVSNKRDFYILLIALAALLFSVIVTAIILIFRRKK